MKELKDWLNSIGVITYVMCNNDATDPNKYPWKLLPYSCCKDGKHYVSVYDICEGEFVDRYCKYMIPFENFDISNIEECVKKYNMQKGED